MRSAQAEHPDRFGTLDLDDSKASMSALPRALWSEEPELALREGALYAPRLARLKAAEQNPPAALDPQGTVLITDGADGLGELVARHLVCDHGARYVLLVSDGRARERGGSELEDAMRELGCELRIVACDVADATELRGLLDTVPAEHPVRMVVHTVGVREDGVIESLDAERLSRAMVAKVDAAVNLHELCGSAELILFSSAAAVFGGSGQGSSAAANSFLDALAHSPRVAPRPRSPGGVGALAWRTGGRRRRGPHARA